MRFEKISKQQWYKDYDIANPNIADEIYNNIKLPQQGSEGSAGMDFFAYEDIIIEPNEVKKIPTGIRWVVNPYADPNVVLYLFPRSGSGIKGLGLMNTVEVIDETYMNADNEGHIILFLVNRGDKAITIKKDKGMVQGVVHKYMICDGAECDDERTCGFGSTD